MVRCPSRGRAWAWPGRRKSRSRVPMQFRVLPSIRRLQFIRPGRPCVYRRCYAAVSDQIITSVSFPSKVRDLEPVSPLDNLVLERLARQPATEQNLNGLIKQYHNYVGRVLPLSLPYESTPSAERSVKADNSEGIVTVVHCVMASTWHRITMSSGFLLNCPSPVPGETLVLTCAHTFEEASSITFVEAGTHGMARRFQGLWRRITLHRAYFLAVSLSLAHQEEK
jgi:hypothetical protein